jgi:hypothetical protein
MWVRAALLVLVLSTVALARATSEVLYSQSEVYSTAVRFVRIDKGCKLTDQDPSAAFVAFECEDGGKIKRGSVEIWKTPSGTHLQVTLGDDPHYVELRWVELIERKLREERGTPPPPAHPRPAPDNPDAGA